MKTYQNLFFGFVILSLMASCSTAPKPIQERISLGMDKSAVLEVLGNPSRSKRVSGADRWSYDTHENAQKKTVHVYFQEGKVQYVGADGEFEKSLLESKQKKTSPEDSGFKDIE